MTPTPLDAAPCATLSFDDSGRIVEANAQLHRWLQHAPGTLEGQSIERILGPAAKVFYSTHLFPLLKLHGAVDELYLALRRSDGADVPCLLSAVRDERSGAALNRCVLMTMWRRREFEAALLEARRSAEAATLAKDQFLAMVSHDLRSPLSAILGWAKLLTSGKLDPAKHARAFAAIQRNAEAQVQLIDDLLDVSRIVSGKLRLSPRPLELAGLVEEAADTCRSSARAKEIELHVAADRAAGTVHADPQRVRQIVWNLVSNAIKFTRRGGHVEVVLQRVDSRVRLAVSDDGEGIDAADVPFLFERFWRSADSAAAEKTGLGLGLAITRSLVELHGGTVSASSPGRGHGSTFAVELPLAVQPALSAENSRPRAPEPAPAAADALLALPVLVVDDDEDARTLLKLVLESAGAEVAVAASVAEALASLAERAPQIVLSDVGMPDEDGYGLIRRLRAHPDPTLRRIPAVAITGLVRTQDRIELLRSGFQAHLSKPIEPSELVALVASLCGRPAVGSPGGSDAART
jgi:signal transduction histidine kinase/ActR/RegA family two-component response regulator